MATPLNVFKTVTADVSDDLDIIYTAPPGNTAIILTAQAANVTTNSSEFTFGHYRNSTNTDTELLKNFVVPGNDAINCVTGKLIVEEGDSVKVQSSGVDIFKITLSLLESLNA